MWVLRIWGPGRVGFRAEAFKIEGSGPSGCGGLRFRALNNFRSGPVQGFACRKVPRAGAAQRISHAG